MGCSIFNHHTDPLLFPPPQVSVCSECLEVTYPVFAPGEEHVPDDGDHVDVEHAVPLWDVGEVQPLGRRPDTPVKLKTHDVRE